jgi:hypothetical protein
MPSSDTRATRRSVLRTTGAAAVGALGATGSATAASCQTGESFYTFDAVEVCNPNGDSTPLYDTCDAVDQVADVPNGKQGVVGDRCETSITAHVRVDFQDDSYPYAWIDEYNLDYA